MIKRFLHKQVQKIEGKKNTKQDRQNGLLDPPLQNETHSIFLHPTDASDPCRSQTWWHTHPTYPIPILS